VAIVKQLTVMMENRPGSLATLCSEMARLAVNISAIQASDARPLGTVRLLVSQLAVAKRVCDTLGLRYLEEEVLAVKVPDRPGALGRLTRKLAEKGINIEYLYCSIAKGATQALVVLGVSDVQAAARVVH
jgi:hypothetical protein